MCKLQRTAEWKGDKRTGIPGIVPRPMCRNRRAKMCCHGESKISADQLGWCELKKLAGRIAAMPRRRGADSVSGIVVVFC